MEECVSWSSRNGVTPGISPFCHTPTRPIWNISPLSAAHSICPARFHRSLLLLFTFHHRQTLGLALSKLHNVLSGYINKHPDDAFIIAGDFNKANLRQVMPNLHQHVSCTTRGPNTLDHCYTQFKNAYNARSLPAFGKSDHAAIFLTPEYKQRLVQGPPVKRAGPPTQKLCYRRLLMMSTGTCSGRVHLTSASSRM